MEKGKNLIIIIFLIIILAILGWIFYDKVLEKKDNSNTENEKQDNLVIEEMKKYSEYKFYDLKKYDEKINGSIVYEEPIPDNVSYIDNASTQIYNYVTDGNNKHYEIENNMLVYYDNGKKYEIKEMTNVSKIGKLNFGVGTANEIVFALSKDGNLYFTNLYDEDGYLETTVEERIKFKQIVSNYKFSTFGIASPEADHIFYVLVAKTLDGQNILFRYLDDNFKEYTQDYTYLIGNRIHNFKINLDATIQFLNSDSLLKNKYFNDNNILVYDMKPIYHNEAFFTYNEEKSFGEYKNFNIIDRNGYLYKAQLSFNESKMEITNITKGNKVISKLGYKYYKKNDTDLKNVVIIYKDGTSEVIEDVLVDNAYDDFEKIRIN